MATIRRQIRVARTAEQVWTVLGDPATIGQWFPGIETCVMSEDDDGLIRTVTVGSGMQLVERIVTVDSIAHRFQYRISGGVFKEHLGTIDAIDLDDGTSLLVYGTDAKPDVMALVIGGASGAALEGLRDLVEATTDALITGASTTDTPTHDQGHS